MHIKICAVDWNKAGGQKESFDGGFVSSRRPLINFKIKISKIGVALQSLSPDFKLRLNFNRVRRSKKDLFRPKVVWQIIDI